MAVVVVLAAVAAMVLLYTCGSGRSDRSSSSVSSSNSNINSRSSGSNSSSSSNANISSSSSSVSNTSSSSVISSSCTSNSCSTSSRCSSSSSSSSSCSSSINCMPNRLKSSSPLYRVLIGSHVQSFEAWLWRSTKNEKNHWTTVTRSPSILLSKTGSTLSEWTNPLWWVGKIVSRSAAQLSLLQDWVNIIKLERPNCGESVKYWVDQSVSILLCGKTGSTLSEWTKPLWSVGEIVSYSFCQYSPFGDWVSILLCGKTGSTRSVWTHPLWWVGELLNRSVGQYPPFIDWVYTVRSNKPIVMSRWGCELISVLPWKGLVFTIRVDS